MQISGKLFSSVSEQLQQMWRTSQVSLLSPTVLQKDTNVTASALISCWKTDFTKHIENMCM